MKDAENKREVKGADRRVVRKLVEGLWLRGHQAEHEGMTVRFDASSKAEASEPFDVLRDVAATAELTIDDGSAEAANSAIAIAASAANPGWWGWERMVDPVDLGYARGTGELFWRYEAGYLCHVVMIAVPGDVDIETHALAIWGVSRTNEPRPNIFDQASAIVTGEENREAVGETFIDAAKAACVAAACSRGSSSKENE